MNTTWTNGVIALTRDFIFGVSVKTEQGWEPISIFDSRDLKQVIRLVDNNPSCPWLNDLQDALQKVYELEPSGYCDS